MYQYSPIDTIHVRLAHRKIRFYIRQSEVERYVRLAYCIFDLNKMFDLLHTFTTKKSMKMKSWPPSAHKELNSVSADGGRFFIFINFLVVKLCRRSKNENFATKKGAELFHPQFSVTRLQTILHRMHKKRPQSVKLKSSQSNTDKPRNNSGKGCHQTDT